MPHPSHPSVGAEAPRAAEPTSPAEQQRSSRFPRSIRSLGHRRMPDALTPRWVKRPGDLDLWPFDLESGVRVTCDVGYLCANFSLPRPLCSRHVRDRQTSDRQTASSL